MHDPRFHYCCAFERHALGRFCCVERAWQALRTITNTNCCDLASLTGRRRPYTDRARAPKQGDISLGESRPYGTSVRTPSVKLACRYAHMTQPQFTASLRCTPYSPSRYSLEAGVCAFLTRRHSFLALTSVDLSASLTSVGLMRILALVP